MGGKGERFGNSIPKQFSIIKDQPYFTYVLKQYLQVDKVDAYLLVTNEDWLDYTTRYAYDILGEKCIGVIDGGRTNLDSARKGILWLKQILDKNDIVLIHDITDPIVDEKAVCDAIGYAGEFGCAAVVTEQVHTLYKKDKNDRICGVIEKSIVGSGYSPEAIKYSIAYDCFTKCSENDIENLTSVVALISKYGYEVLAIISRQVDLKITFKEDMEVVKRILRI